MEKNKGRPRIYDADELADKLMDYINNSDDPMIEEFCYNEHVNKDTIYRLEKNNERLSDAIKRCHVKQEILTVRGVQNGTINPTFGIFKLKQKRFGWSDKQEVEMSGNLNLTIEDQLLELVDDDESK